MVELAVASTGVGTWAALKGDVMVPDKRRVHHDPRNRVTGGRTTHRCGGRGTDADGVRWQARTGRRRPLPSHHRHGRVGCRASAPELLSSVVRGAVVCRLGSRRDGHSSRDRQSRRRANRRHPKTDTDCHSHPAPACRSCHPPAPSCTAACHRTSHSRDRPRSTCAAPGPHTHPWMSNASPQT